MTDEFQRVLVSLSIALGLLGFAGPGHAQSGGASAGTLGALVTAAKAEGDLTLYSSMPENATKRLTDAFTTKYGIKVGFLRISSAPLMQRFANEAEAGKGSADMAIFTGGVVPFAKEGIKKGWIEAISEAKLPALTDGTYPAKFDLGVTAIVSIGPWGIAYNTNKVKGTDIPKDWKDLANPKWKGQLLLHDPTISEAYDDFWGALRERYGEPFFAMIRSQTPRTYGNAIHAIQGLSAGEGALLIPSTGALAQGAVDKGAPVAMVYLPYTTGVEMQVMLGARNRSKAPNAARLLANYVLSEEGNRVFNNDPGSFSVYDTTGLPREYRPGRTEQVSGTAARLDAFKKSLGF